MKGAGLRSWRGRERPAPLLRYRAAWLREAVALSALDTALNAIDEPAVVVDLGGEILHANTNAQILLARDRRGVSRSLVNAIAGMRADLTWDLTPLRGTQAPRGFLAMLRAPRRETSGPDPVNAAALRWHLTARQIDVLRLVARGFTNVLIADDLGISEGTVEFHVAAIFDKAGVDNRATLIVKLLAVVQP
jgi:DNA-binding CsgD family transcriptional regulator